MVSELGTRSSVRTCAVTEIVLVVFAPLTHPLSSAGNKYIGCILGGSRESGGKTGNHLHSIDAMKIESTNPLSLLWTLSPWSDLTCYI